MRKNKAAYLYVLPLAFITIFIIYLPTIMTFGYSLVNMNLLQPEPLAFKGFANYAKVLREPSVWTASGNSLWIAVVVLVLTILFGLAFAMMLNINSPVKGILTGIAIIPWAMPGIVNGIIWRWMFHPSFGLVNSILQKTGMAEAPVQWFSGRWTVLAIVAVSAAWKAIPLAAITFLSAFQGIPGQLYESAEIDGCGAVSRFTHITLPLLRPAFGIVLTTTSITAINVLDEIVSLVGMASANNSLMTEIYLRTFKYMRFSEGSALSYLLMLVCAIIGVFYVRKVYTRVGYM